MMTGYTLETTEPTERERFGAWLKAERERIRLPRSVVAERAGISEQQLYRIETGETASRMDTLKAIAQALGIDETEVLVRAGLVVRTETPATPGTSPDPDEALILYIYRLADGELKTTIREKIAEALHGVNPQQRHHMAAEAAKREQRDIDTEIVTQTEGLLTRAERETGKRVG